MIDGVGLRPLKRIEDQRGAVLHWLRGDWPEFKGFGEVYFTTVHPGHIKGWNRHSRVTLNLAVPSGRARIVLQDDRDGSPTRGTTETVEIGGADHVLLTVPPGLWVAFTAVGEATAILANCADGPHDPAEMDRRDIADPAFPFDWNRP